MLRKIQTVVVIIVTGMNLLCLPMAQCQQTNESAEVQARRSKFKEIFDRLAPVKIYGKVTDTKGAPIEDAVVTISWDGVGSLIGERDSDGRDSVKTDANGRWEFTVNKPDRAFITDVSKTGYDYWIEPNIETYSRNFVYKPTAKDAPVISVLRKKGETTFLLFREESEIIRVASPHSQTNSLDVLAKRSAPTPAYRYEDVRVAVNYQLATGRWEITYTATNGTDGFMFGTNRLYEIPLEGYQKQAVLDGPPWPRYLYVRSRSPAIYSCLDVEYDLWKATATNMGFRIGYKAWINPYGERNLEYETALDGEWRLADQLEDDAKKSLRQHKHPAKPDLQKLIQEARDKRKAGG